MQQQFKKLLNGYDTIECAYFLAPTNFDAFPFKKLIEQRERIRAGKKGDFAVVNLAEQEFMLKPYGSSSGYPIILENSEFTIQCGEYNNPSFFVKFSSKALWIYGIDALHKKFLDWAFEMGLYPLREEGLSRVDFTIDYDVQEIDFNEDSFVSLANKDSKYRDNGKEQTFMFGRGDIVLRVYDKISEINDASQKFWFYDLWKQEKDVWRIEWQIRKETLKRFSIRSIESLKTFQGDLLNYLFCSHTTLRKPSNDSNRSRWDLHPLWLQAMKDIKEFSRYGLLKSYDKQKPIDERLMRVAVSVYGYMKRVSALNYLKNGESFSNPNEAMKKLNEYMSMVHDPLTWSEDVQKRIDKERLGQW